VPYTLALEPIPPAQGLPSIHKLYVFGDSLSDTGNLEAATLSFLPNAQNYFMGRFSDGYLWIDDLAKQYHTTVQDKQFIENYAVGGATAFPYMDLVSIFHWGYYLVGSLGNQLYDFTKTHKRFRPDDLIIIWIGANDLLWAGDMYFCGKLTKACIEGHVQKANQNNIVQKAFNSVKAQVQKMEKRGAQHIILVGLPDFSEVPRYIFQQPAVAALKKADAHAYNEELKAFVRENQAAGHAILFYDLNRVLQKLINHPSEQAKYKITDTVHSCLYRHQEPRFSDWESIALNRYNPFAMVAIIPVFRDALPNPHHYRLQQFKEFVDKKCGAHYLFWDTLHPTKKGHFVIFQHFLAFIDKHFKVARPHKDNDFCYNLHVINKGWYLLNVSQKDSRCGSKHNYLLKNSEKLVSVAYDQPVKLNAVLGKSMIFSHLPRPVQGLGATIQCTGTTLIHFSCKEITESDPSCFSRQGIFNEK
ncbi:SGNH/GDSL hydrolase family protein, partial [Rickettsiella grylli]|uniref:SGNH/GDSL hydrolase family protein n=1 Tax=Rickettsiella grylli TaxID=59196 RepID=UPI000B0EDDB7